RVSNGRPSASASASAWLLSAVRGPSSTQIRGFFTVLGSADVQFSNRKPEPRPSRDYRLQWPSPHLEHRNASRGGQRLPSKQMCQQGATLMSRRGGRGRGALVSADSSRVRSREFHSTPAGSGNPPRNLCRTSP